MKSRRGSGGIVKRQQWIGIVEIHDCPRPVGTRQIKKEEKEEEWSSFNVKYLKKIK